MVPGGPIKVELNPRHIILAGLPPPAAANCFSSSRRRFRSFRSRSFSRSRSRSRFLSRDSLSLSVFSDRESLFDSGLSSASKTRPSLPRNSLVPLPFCDSLLGFPPAAMTGVMVSELGIPPGPAPTDPSLELFKGMISIPGRRSSVMFE